MPIRKSEKSSVNSDMKSLPQVIGRTHKEEGERLRVQRMISRVQILILLQ